MNEQAPTRIYQKDRRLFAKLQTMPIDKLLVQPVGALPFAVRALNYCAKNNIKTIGQLSILKTEDLLKADNMGRKTVAHVESYLGEIGLGLDGKRSDRIPNVLSADYLNGARAMRFAIMGELSSRGVPAEIVSYIGRMPIPNDGEEL